MAFKMTDETKKDVLQKIARLKGTSVMVIDLAQVRKNYLRFKENFPDVQVYYAVKANSHPLIIKTLFELGSSFDVASLPEFHLVRENIKNLLPSEQQEFIWEKIIYAHPIKMIKTLHELEPYKPLVTFDNFDELEKIKKHCPSAGVILRLEVPNEGSVVNLSSKFGVSREDAVALAIKTFEMGFLMEGLSFHVGSQCTNFDNYRAGLNFAAEVFEEVEKKGYKIRNSKTGRRILDIGGGFPAEEYNPDIISFEELAEKLNKEMKRLFPDDIEFIAEPGRFLVANTCTLVVTVIGRAFRHGIVSYYIDDGIYGAFSGQVFDHQIYTLKAFKDGEKEKCIIFGPTCDGFDTVSPSTNDKGYPFGWLPRIEVGELMYAENMGAYTLASATNFNGFPIAKTVCVNK
ncbi:MAG TPA: type III PLP-dependent enzyme [bacterium]|nr:type III PLP-dependent enzyme [bacterium]HPP30115.1 type III PLP-dependent enzyme [bacterium]